MTEVKMSAKDLHLWYGEMEALKGVSLDMNKNSVTALIGPSGCGKSTFLKTLNRMNDLVEGCRIEGDVRLDGEDIFRKGIDLAELRKRVGMVFQKPNPFPMSIYDNIAYGPRVHGIRKKKVLDEIVEKALRGAALWDEVHDRLRKSAMGLSGGQQQRLCIARVLAVEPEVVLMDEPTSALDPISTQRIEDLMAELKQKYTIVIVTHNMQQAARIADRTAFFLKGEIIEAGDTLQIFQQPKDKRTEDYITGRFGGYGERSSEENMNRILMNTAMEGLHESMLEMGRLCERGIDEVLSAIYRSDKELAATVVARDDSIDEMERRIETQCLSILARFSPVANDLRAVTAAMGIISDLERIGDQCADIAEMVEHLCGADKHIQPMADLRLMGDTARSMVHDALDSYIGGDAEKAKGVTMRDDIVDAALERVILHLTNIMRESPDAVSQAVDMLFVAKYFERIADHATNIGEWSVYLSTGTHPLDKELRQE